VEIQFAPVCPVQTDDGRGPRVEPSAAGRARDTEIRGERHVPGLANEVPKPVIIALLRAGPARHADDHPPFRRPRSTPRRRCKASACARPDRLRDDNSARKSRNVRADRSDSSWVPQCSAM
jgi:hypothetical protein